MIRGCGLAALIGAALALAGCVGGGDADTPLIPSDPAAGTDELQITEVIERFNTAVLQRDATTMCESVLLESARPGRDTADCAARVLASIRRDPSRWADLDTRGAIVVRGRTARVTGVQEGRSEDLDLRFRQDGGRWFLVPFD